MKQTTMGANKVDPIKKDLPKPAGQPSGTDAYKKANNKPRGANWKNPNGK